MLQHHTNWPGAYKESLVFGSPVFWDVSAEVGRWETGLQVPRGRAEVRTVSFDYG